METGKKKECWKSRNVNITGFGFQAFTKKKKS